MQGAAGKALKFRFILQYFAAAPQRALNAAGLHIFRPTLRKAGRHNQQNHIFMETINRVELQGNVGNVRIQKAGETQVAHFSLATNRVSRSKEGENVVEACWHNIEAWEGQGIDDLSKIVKGCPMHILGRLRYTRYTGSDDVERTSTDVVATKIDFLNN